VKRKSGFRIAALALVAVGVLAMPTIVQAHKKKFATGVTAAAQNKNQVRGTVTSGKARCVPQRTVRLFSSTGVLEATATTDAQGSFRIDNKNLALGTHYVNVQKRPLKKTRKHRHVCAGATISIVVS
jgi:hypothetical protein